MGAVSQSNALCGNKMFDCGEQKLLVSLLGVVPAAAGSSSQYLRELKFGLEDSAAFSVLVPMSPEFHSWATVRGRLGQ